MRITYSPLIDVTAKMDTIEADLEGHITLTGVIKNRPARLVFQLDEALRFYRELKAMDIEGLARVHG